MSLEPALATITYLVGFSLFLGAIELLYLCRDKLFTEVWSFQNLQSELKIEKVFSLNGFRNLLMLEIVLTTALYFYPSALVVGLLLLIHLLVCMRFRGTFNGGSDMLTVVVLTGLLIAYCGYAKAGLIYIAIHTLFSYFKAGLVKLRQPDWRRGHAVSAFLKRSLFADVQNFEIPFAKFLGWGLIVFELSSLLLLLQPQIVWIYFGIAIFFHFVNYLIFGLNRFFWIWLSAWPAVIYTVGLI